MSFYTTNREAKLEMKSFLPLGNTSTGGWSSGATIHPCPSVAHRVISQRCNTSVAFSA
jgi:hypothetical protein